MSSYIPDNWVVVKFKGDNPHYRILAGWSGGYATADCWRMNSGITKVDAVGDDLHFYGSSGSCYICGKKSYMLRMNNAYVWHTLEQEWGDKVELMPEDTDWLTLEWEPKNERG